MSMGTGENADSLPPTEPTPAVLIEYDQIRGRWRSAYLHDEVVMGDAEPLFGRWCDEVTQ